ENGSKVSNTKERGSLMNEIENSYGDRNLLDWTSMNIPGSKILFLVLEGKETTRSDLRESLERVKSLKLIQLILHGFNPTVVCHSFFDILWFNSADG
ncbi:hypothetical protein Tco_1534826, partial [Tanacetum coccineum]